MPIKIAIFDDNQNRRNSLKILVDETADMTCVGTFNDCTNVIENVEGCAPQVILMDIDMPKVNGIEGVHLLRRRFTDICIIMQTVFEDDDKIVSAISAGANGYILKKTHPAKIIEGIRDVLDGGAPMTSSVAKRILELFQAGSVKKVTHDYLLTEKEKEILTELVKGFSYKMIAANKSLSVFTVNAHIRNIYRKMQVNSVAEAVIKAIQQNLV